MLRGASEVYKRAVDGARSAAQIFRNAVTPATGRIITTKQLSDYFSLRSQAWTGETVNDETALRVASFYGCVRILSESVALMPLYLHQRVNSGTRLAVGHPLYDVLQHGANGWMTPYELKRLAMVHLCLRGNSYWRVVRAINGRGVEALLPLEPDRMGVRMEKGALLYDYIATSGRAITYTQADILHLRSMSTDGIVGRSILTAAAQSVGLGIAEQKHAAHVFKNGARPSGVLTHPGQLPEDAYNRLRDEFAARYTGNENAHKPLILEEGLSWAPLSMTSQDAQLIESRKFTRSEIAMFFGVPPHMLGDVDKSTSWGSGIEQQGRGFVLFTLLPHLINLTSAIHRDLLSQTERKLYFAKFDTDILTEADFKSRQEGRAIMRRNGIINANEWREAEGWNARDDAGGQQYIVESNMQANNGNEGAPANA